MRLPSLLALGATASATNLFVADYSGNITSLQLSEENGNYNLTTAHVNNGCAPNPSWLTLDSARGLLFCLNEGLATPNGSLASFSINTDGSLRQVANETTINGPVSGAIYGEPTGQRAIALAHYGGSAVSSWLIQDNGNVTHNQDIFFTLDGPGPDPERQDAPHAHEAITDPTGQYIIVPDLGADLVRIFSWDIESLKLTELDPLVTAPGSGPRHVAFYTPYGAPGGTTYMYLVGELTATVTGYAVSYKSDNEGLDFEDIGFQSTTWLHALPQRNAPAEINISPDNRFLIISNRNDTSFNLPSATGTSDSISTWKLHESTGNLTFHQLWPAGGAFPRHYETNAGGTLVAVGLQNSQAVAVLGRNAGTGLIGEPVARWVGGGNITAVVWDEQRAWGQLGS